jgi:hypothetical protein
MHLEPTIRCWIFAWVSLILQGDQFLKKSLIGHAKKRKIRNFPLIVFLLPIQSINTN